MNVRWENLVKGQTMSLAYMTRADRTFSVFTPRGDVVISLREQLYKKRNQLENELEFNRI